MSERYDNIIYKRFLKSKTIKVIPSSMTRIRLTVYIEDFKEVFSIDHAYVEDTEAEETTMADITTTCHPIRSNVISVINLDAN